MQEVQEVGGDGRVRGLDEDAFASGREVSMMAALPPLSAVTFTSGEYRALFKAFFEKVI